MTFFVAGRNRFSPDSSLGLASLSASGLETVTYDPLSKACHSFHQTHGRGHAAPEPLAQNHRRAGRPSLLHGPEQAERGRAGRSVPFESRVRPAMVFAYLAEGLYEDPVLWLRHILPGTNGRAVANVLRRMIRVLHQRVQLQLGRILYTVQCKTAKPHSSTHNLSHRSASLQSG